MRYRAESYSEVIEELRPLLIDHYEEVAMYKDYIDLNPDFDQYEALDELGLLDIFTARDNDGNLIGYCITFLNKHLHYQDHIYGANDVIYVAPEYRHTEVAPELIIQVEDRLRDRGVSVITYHMKTYKPFATLMESLGFDEAETIYTKYIR